MKCCPSTSPAITCGLPSIRGMLVSTSTAAGLSRTSLAPVFESGRRKTLEREDLGQTRAGENEQLDARQDERALVLRALCSGQAHEFLLARVTLTLGLLRHPPAEQRGHPSSCSGPRSHAAGRSLTASHSRRRGRHELAASAPVLALTVARRHGTRQASVARSQSPTALRGLVEPRPGRRAPRIDSPPVFRPARSRRAPRSRRAAERRAHSGDRNPGPPRVADAKVPQRAPANVASRTHRQTPLALAGAAHPSLHHAYYGARGSAWAEQQPVGGSGRRRRA